VDEAAARTELVRASRRLVADGLCVGTAGNLSLRLRDRVLVTPSGRAGEGLDETLVCLVDPVSGEQLDGPEPSSELPMHLAAYRATGAGAVVHTHSPFATVVATTLTELPAIHYTIASLGGPVRVAPYALFGSAALAANLAMALEGRSAALLQSHGALTIGGTLAQAYDRAVLLEWLCALHWRCLQVGTPRLLDEAELAEALEEFDRRHYGEASSEV
jgi:L-fuculose-phosphate aldolase